MAGVQDKNVGKENEIAMKIDSFGGFGKDRSYTIPKKQMYLQQQQQDRKSQLFGVDYIDFLSQLKYVKKNDCI